MMEQNQIADRFNAGKIQWSLVDLKALEPMIRVAEYGARKYAPDNYRKGLKTRQILESLLRHTIAFLEGEDNDYDENCEGCKAGECRIHSGLSHIGHIQWNGMALQNTMTNHPELDNRYSEIEKQKDK